MAEPIVVDETEGDTELQEAVGAMRRRRMLAIGGVTAALVVAAAVLWWPQNDCQKLADEACTRGILHCERAREAMRSDRIEADECSDYLDRLEARDARSVFIELPRRFPEATYTEEEDEAVRTDGQYYMSGGATTPQ